MDGLEQETISIEGEEEGKRLDSILAKRYSEIKSRTYFQYLIENGYVLLNGRPVKKRLKPKKGDEVEIFFALTKEIDVVPENIPLNILYEDQDLIVVNKAAGMVVHPAPGNWKNTFVNALLYHCKYLPDCRELRKSDSSFSQTSLNELRPGIVHRLDKDTSGVLVAAKSPVAQQRLIEMFSERRVYKEYLAIVIGNPGEGEFRSYIGRHPVQRKKMAVLENGGKLAVTKYRTQAFDGKLSFVDIVIETGRTHQIRVHFSHQKTPVLGDPLYGSLQANKRYLATRQLLHAKRICFNHPMTKKPLEFQAELPEDMAFFVRKIKNEGKL